MTECVCPYILYYDSMLAFKQYTCCGLINWYTVCKQIISNILHTSNIDVYIYIVL